MRYLYGASGHAKVVVDILKSSNNYLIHGFFDDNKLMKDFQGIKFLGKLEEWNVTNKDKILITIGDNLIRKKITDSVKMAFFKAIHKSAIVSSSSNIEEGTVVMANTIINSESNIGKHCIINTASVIEHDCIIENFVHISPNATLAGNVKVGEGTHIGTGVSSYGWYRAKLYK